MHGVNFSSIVMIGAQQMTYSYYLTDYLSFTLLHAYACALCMHVHNVSLFDYLTNALTTGPIRMVS